MLFEWVIFMERWTTFLSIYMAKGDNDVVNRIILECYYCTLSTERPVGDHTDTDIVNAAEDK